MLKALSLVGGGRMAATAAQALTLLMMARNLGPPGFAEFAAVLGALMALNLIADGGAMYAVARHHVSDHTVVEIFRAGRLLSAGTLVISVPVVAALAYLSHSAVLAACIPLCLWVPFERQLEVTGAYLMAKGAQHLVGGTYVLRRMPTLVVVLIFHRPEHVVWAFSVSMLAAAAVSSWMLTRRAAACTTGWNEGGVRVLPTRDTWAMLRPFWAAIAGQGIRQVDVAVLTASAGTVVAGLLAPATRLAPALLLVPGTYTQLLLARLASTREVLTTRGVVILGAVTAAVFAPVAATAGLWIPLLLGDAYAASVGVVQIVIGGLVFAAMSSAYASGLHATDRASSVAAVVWISSILTIAAVAALGVTAGAAGAAWAVALGYVLQFFLMAAAYRARRVPSLRRRKERTTA